MEIISLNLDQYTDFGLCAIVKVKCIHTSVLLLSLMLDSDSKEDGVRSCYNGKYFQDFTYPPNVSPTATTWCQ